MLSDVEVLQLLLISGNVHSNPGPEVEEFSKCLSIYHQNIRSIRTKINYIIDNWLDYDIICFTETHLNDSISNDSIILDNHNMLYRMDKSNHFGGIVIYIADHLTSKRILELDHYLPESLWVKIQNKTESFLLCTVYRQPDSTVEFWNRFNLCIEKAFELCDKVIIVGDLMKIN
jgi:exonuclease III